MKRQDKNVLLFCEPEQERSDERACGEIERSIRFLTRPLDHVGVGGVPAQVDSLESKWRDTPEMNELHRLVADLAEGRPQRLVALHQSAERTLERSHIQ